MNGADTVTWEGAGGGYLALLGSFRVVYCVWMSAAVAVQLRSHIRWVRVCGETRELPRVLGCARLPRLAEGAFTLLGLILVASLVMAASGMRGAGASLVVAGVAALLYFPQVIRIPEVRRKPGTVPVILLLLGAAVLTGPSESVAWVCLTTIKAVVAQIYLSSGIVKLRQAGWKWASGAMLRMSLLRYHLRDENRAALWFARREGLCRSASIAVLGFELSFWLVIPFPQLAWVYLPLGVAFHLGTALLMRIHYWIYLFPAYAAFLLAR